MNLTTGVLAALAAVVASSLITVILLLFVKSRRYDEERSRAIIDSMRDAFERDIYRLNDRLMATEARWRDVNHLLVSSQNLGLTEKRTNRAVHKSEFLKSAGITEGDLEIDKKLVFVLTPFNERYRREFEAIQSVCQEVGLRVMRGDEEYAHGDILHHILKALIRANIVIANIDGRNPNVFYELGLAHAMDKRTILLSRSVSDLPVDIKSKRIIVYDELDQLKMRVKDELVKTILSDEG